MDDINVDYREMYLQMARTSEKVINLIIAAQKMCEDIYVKAEPLKVFSSYERKNKVN